MWSVNTKQKRSYFINEKELSMGPVLIDGAVQENQLTDEEYVIHRAKCSQQLDEATAKAWMITAKTLFPRNFAVQVRLYNHKLLISQ